MNLSKCPVIAGKHSGKLIRCTNEVQADYLLLLEAANKGNHWARVAVKELQSLNTGVHDKKNVYIDPVRVGKRNLDQFEVFLPGLRATVERWPNDQFLVVGLTLDHRYSEAKEGAEPGLYRVSRESDTKRWAPEYCEGGKVKQEKNRPVAIADSGYINAMYAADGVAKRIKSAPGTSAISLNEDGFDLHFTPGAKRVGGLVQYNALNIKSIRGSSVQLAYTMAQARNVAGVQWISDHGGSAVLTQAMQILADRGVKLSGHTAFLVNPRTSPKDAALLAHRLDMTLDEKFSKTGWDLVGAASMGLASSERMRNGKDLYNGKSRFRGALNGFVQSSAVAGSGLFVAAAATGTLPALASIAGILTVTTGVVSAAVTGVAIGKEATNDIVHRFNKKH